MERLIPKQKVSFYNNSIDHLVLKTKTWVSEIDFISVEQNFLKELLIEHIMSLCETQNFQRAKFLLSGIENESMFGIELKTNVEDHTVNLSLLIENIYLKKEDIIRKNHGDLKLELKSYIENFKSLKKEVFDLVLEIMKKEKQKRLLPN